VLAALTQWGAEVLASGAAGDAGRTAAQRPVPDAPVFWLDPGWSREVPRAALRALEALRRALAYADSGAGWLVVAVRGGWGLGLAVMLALAAGAHWLLGRLRPVAGAA